MNDPHSILTNKQITSLAMVPMFEQLYHTMFLIMKRYQGASRLFIALDGIAPLVKWELQKKRRFQYNRSANITSESFGREALTPGSSLMFFIERCLFWVAKDFLVQQNATYKNSHAKRNPFVVIDNACRAGEAEWKNIQHLKISIEEQFSALGLSSSSSSISFSKLITETPHNVGGVRRILCASDADSMLMTLAYPIQSLYTVDVSSSSCKNILFSPHSVIHSLAIIDPINFLALRDGLFLLVLLCMGSDYVSRLQGMPSLSHSWMRFLIWIKNFSNAHDWKLINRSNRTINIGAVQSLLSFCQSSNESPTDHHATAFEHADDFNFDMGDKDDFKMDEEMNSRSFPLKVCSIDSYFALLACNLDIIFTGVCRFFSLERVLSPSIEDVISWKPTYDRAITPAGDSPDSSLLIPGAYAMMLLPRSGYSCLAKPLQALKRNDDLRAFEGILSLEDGNELISPLKHSSISELVECSQLLSSLSFSTLERDFTFCSRQPSVISLRNTDIAKSQMGSSSENKFSKLFSVERSIPLEACSFEAYGRIPFGLSLAIPTVNAKILLPYVNVPSLYQPNDPAIGCWTSLESEIGLMNSLMETRVITPSSPHSKSN